MLLALVSVGFSAELTLEVAPPGQSARRIVIHDVEPGPLPVVEFADGPDAAWRLAVEVLPAGAGVRLTVGFERAERGPAGAWVVQPSPRKLVDVALNNHVNLAWERDFPIVDAGGAWAYVSSAMSFGASLDDGAVSTVELPEVRRLDVALEGDRHAAVALTLVEPEDGVQPLLELSTGRRTVRRVSLDLRTTETGARVEVTEVEGRRTNRRIRLESPSTRSVDIGDGRTSSVHADRFRPGSPPEVVERESVELRVVRPPEP